MDPLAVTYLSSHVDRVGIKMNRTLTVHSKTRNTEQLSRVTITAQLIKSYFEDVRVSADVVIRTCMCVSKIRANFMSLFLLENQILLSALW